MRDFLPIKMHKSPHKAGFHADLLPDRLILSEGPARIEGASRTPVAGMTANLSSSGLPPSLADKMKSTQSSLPCNPLGSVWQQQ
jgi:hypothetical protein